MKKLMITAAAVAMTAGAFAVPSVYDYKASVKHIYLKPVKLTGSYCKGVEVYQKIQKSASLKGYLIMDDAGVTSKEISASPAKCFDHGRSRGFLVVQNSSAEKDFRAPKLLPAVLDAKYMDTKFVSPAQAAKSGLAEGTLFVGGDSVAAIRPQLDSKGPFAAAAGNAYADYAWQSVYLFGQYNGPNWFRIVNSAATAPGDSTTADGFTGPFAAFEKAWDGNLPTELQRGISAEASVLSNDGLHYVWSYFHDTWMNGTGIGKYTYVGDKTKKLCCGLSVTVQGGRQLNTLSGNLKGGIFICTENGIDVNDPGYNFFDADMYRWEDQFVFKRLVPGVTFTDAWQNDLWKDGEIEQETTDVCYGTWSIKYNNKFFDEKSPIYKATKDIAAILGKTEAQIQEMLNPTLTPQATPHTEAVKGIGELTATILSAGYYLNKSNYAKVLDGDEIYTTPDPRDTGVDLRASIPMITPAFATYYGLNAWN